MRIILQVVLALCLANVFVVAFYQKEVVITAPNGIHLRPATLFVNKAKQYQSDITVTSNGKSVNAKSLFKLQTLALTQGSAVTVSAEGSDEKEAVDRLAELLSTLE